MKQHPETYERDPDWCYEHQAPADECAGCNEKATFPALSEDTLAYIESATQFYDDKESRCMALPANEEPSEQERDS